jgi:hypothetical protein
VIAGHSRAAFATPLHQLSGSAMKINIGFSDQDRKGSHAAKNEYAQ